jgi:hypothetical protein
MECFFTTTKDCARNTQSWVHPSQQYSRLLARGRTRILCESRVAAPMLRAFPGRTSPHPIPSRYTYRGKNRRMPQECLRECGYAALGPDLRTHRPAVAGHTSDVDLIFLLPMLAYCLSEPWRLPRGNLDSRGSDTMPASSRKAP